MKHLQIVIVVAVAFFFALATLKICRGMYQKELNEAFERGVRWGEREKQHLVVHDGVTNKFDSIVEAMKFAPTGSTIYAAAGYWNLGTNRLTMPEGGTFIGSAYGTGFEVEPLKGYTSSVSMDENSRIRFGTNAPASPLTRRQSR